MKKEKGFAVLGVLLLPVILIGSLLVLIFALKSFTSVNPGEVGIKTYFGKVAEEPLAEGFHWKHPLEKVTHMDLKIRSATGEYKAASYDMQDVFINMTINYALKESEAPHIFKTVGTDWFNRIVSPAVSESVKAEVALHAASEILKKRSEIRERAANRIRDWLDKYGIEIHEVSLANIQFSKEYQHAIEQKQLQEQLAEQKKHELRRVKTEALMKEEQARGEANAKVAIAEADAKANKLIAESLTGSLLNLKYYEKWDGKLPQMLLGEKQNTLLNVPVN